MIHAMRVISRVISLLTRELTPSEQLLKLIVLKPFYKFLPVRIGFRQNTEQKTWS